MEGAETPPTSGGDGSSNSNSKPWGAVAIDLGTVASRIAIWSDGDVLLVPNERGRYSTPTCVAFTHGLILVGDAAIEQVRNNLENTIFAPQRLIGFKFGNPWVQWYMRLQPTQVVCGDNDKPVIRVKPEGTDIHLRPEEIVAILLKHLKTLAEKFLGRPVVDVVVAVPSCYGKVQREAMLLSCEWAGLRVRELVKSPTAAAVAAQRLLQVLPDLSEKAGEQHQVLVCDIGGSYFNYSFLTVEAGLITERAIGTELFDLDACLTRLCVQDLRDKHSVNIGSNPGVLLRLRKACEQAKRHLTDHYQGCVDVREIIGSRDYICHVSRDQFEALCQDDIEALLGPISWCLEDMGIDRDAIDHVVLVGGSARIPKIRALFRDYFYGKAPAEVERPDTFVVCGAAVYAASLSPLGSCGHVPPGIFQIRIAEVMPWAAVGDEEDEEPESERPPPLNGLLSSDGEVTIVAGLKSEALEREGTDGIVSFL